MNTVTLPYPPATNHLYRTLVQGGKAIRVTTTRAKRYKAEVVRLAKGMEYLEGPVTVTFEVYRPEKRGDLDGVFKVILDALKGITYEDDKQVDVIIAMRFEDPDNPRVEVTVEPTK